MLENLFKKQIVEPSKTGKFIVLDGPDDSTRKSQIEMLAKTLEVSGYNGTLFEFPQYDSAASAVLEKYQNGGYGELGAEAASIIYSLDRLDASAKLREYLDQGMIVLADGYVTTNAGYQGSRIEDYSDRVKYYKWLDNLEYGTFGIPKPELTIILNNNNENENGSKAIEQSYLEIAELFPNCRLVECTENGKPLSPGEIHGKVWDLVRRIALKNLESKPAA